MMKNVIGNWNISGTYTFQSPEYATVQSGVDSNLNGDTAGDRAIINPAGAANLGTGVQAFNAAGQVVPKTLPDGISDNPVIVAYVANNSNARYVVAGRGARSNGGRTNIPPAHTHHFHLSLLQRLHN